MFFYANTATLFSVVVASRVIAWLWLLVVNMLKSNRQLHEYIPLYSSYLWSLCRLRRCWPAQPESRPDAASQTRPATCSFCNIKKTVAINHTPTPIRSKIYTCIQAYGGKQWKTILRYILCRWDHFEAEPPLYVLARFDGTKPQVLHNDRKSIL